jgi:hypothetical protein
VVINSDGTQQYWENDIKRTVKEFKAIKIQKWFR